MTAPIFKIALDKGSKYEFTVQVNSGGVLLPLTSWTNAVLTITESDTFGATVLDTISGTFNAAQGQVYVDFLSAHTASYVWSNASYKVEATDAAGQVRRLVQGVVTVNN